MIGFLVRRLLQAVVVIIGVIAFMFVLIHLIPGGEARAVLGPKAQPVAIAQFNKENGLDLPLWDQFLHYLWNLSHFDLGRSYTLNQSVGALIGEALPKTLILVGLATLLAVVVAIPLGVYQVVRRNKPEDYIITGVSFILYAVPGIPAGHAAHPVVRGLHPDLPDRGPPEHVHHRHPLRSPRRSSCRSSPWPPSASHPSAVTCGRP